MNSGNLSCENIDVRAPFDARTYGFRGAECDSKPCIKKRVNIKYF